MSFKKTTKVRNDFLNPIVSQLVALRKHRGMTQEEVNDQIGVSDRLVSKWECGMRTPTVFHLICWAQVLDSELTVVTSSYEPFDRGLVACNDNAFGCIQS